MEYPIPNPSGNKMLSLVNDCLLYTSSLDYEGRVLVLSPDTLKESCWTPQNQLWLAHDGFGCSPHAVGPVSYTHLDVYKRQVLAVRVAETVDDRCVDFELMVGLADVVEAVVDLSLIHI